MIEVMSTYWVKETKYMYHVSSLDIEYKYSLCCILVGDKDRLDRCSEFKMQRWLLQRSYSQRLMMMRGLFNPKNCWETEDILAFGTWEEEKKKKERRMLWYEEDFAFAGNRREDLTFCPTFIIFIQSLSSAESYIMSSLPTHYTTLCNAFKACPFLAVLWPFYFFPHFPQYNAIKRINGVPFSLTPQTTIVIILKLMTKLQMLEFQAN